MLDVKLIRMQLKISRRLSFTVANNDLCAYTYFECIINIFWKAIFRKVFFKCGDYMSLVTRSYTKNVSLCKYRLSR